MLKGYSGDPIRVDRIGRESESILNPALTVMLMAQPNVVSDVLNNTTFRGRGLTARFLYCMPDSSVGERKIILNMLQEKHLKRFDRREAMRNCRKFKTVAEIQPMTSVG